MYECLRVFVCMCVGEGELHDFNADWLERL